MYDTILGIILTIVSPSTYRALFLRRMKIAVYLSGGQIVRFYVKSFNVIIDGSRSSYSFKGAVETGEGGQMLFDPEKIIAVRRVTWFR